jgi:hypothetical protein
MPLKQEAQQLLNNRFWQLIKSEFEAEYFDRWLNALTVQEREDIHLETKVFKDLISRIETEAEQYEPPLLGAA